VAPVALALPNDSERPAGPALLGRTKRVEHLVREHFAFVWRVARRLGLAPADADDAVQRVMLIASQRLDDIAAGSERAFLFRTAAHVTSKAHRSRRRRPEDAREDCGEEADPGPTPEDLVEQRRARAELDQILGSLPAELRAAFVLFEIEGLSQAEVAHALGIAQGTVASRLRRAREEFTRIAIRRGLLPRGAST
jgi:RNA polymerase sigma-70 factor (ECF subfamily)